MRERAIGGGVGEVPQVDLISTSVTYPAGLDPPAMASGSKTAHGCIAARNPWEPFNPWVRNRGIAFLTGWTGF